MTTTQGIQDIQNAQRAMLQLLASVKPGGALGRAVKYASIAAHRYTTSITHVWHFKGGALRASHRIDFRESENLAEITLDESAINPRGQRPSVYGPFEHRRGGSHAFYERTEREYGPQIARIGARAYVSELP